MNATPLMPRAGATTAASAPAARASSSYGLLLSGRQGPVGNLFLRQDHDRCRRFGNYAGPESGYGKSQLEFIGTESDLHAVPFQPNSNELLEQLYRDDLTNTAGCFNRLPELRHHCFHLPVLIVFV